MRTTVSSLSATIFLFYILLACIVSIATTPDFAHAQGAASSFIPQAIGGWTFDEGSGDTVKDSFGTAQGVFVNTPSWVAGKAGTALDFANTSWIRATSGGSINNLGAFSIVAWVNPRTGGRIITKGSTRPVYYYLALSPKGSGSIDFGVGYDGTIAEWSTATGTVLSNGWHQVGVTYSPNGQVGIYLDGVPQSSRVVSIAAGSRVADDSTFFIGSRGDGTANFDGQLDTIRIFNQSLSVDDIRRIYETDTYRKPNIIVIMTDDQDDEGSLDTMPQVQSLLKAHGVRFLNSFATNPLCCSSRASFLTGQFSHNNGVWQNAHNTNGYDGGYGALYPTEANTLPVWLQQAGYRTGLIGKYLNFYGEEPTTLANPSTHIPSGWSTWNGLVDPTTYSYFNYTINNNGTLESYGSSSSEYQTAVLTQKAIRFLDSESSQPFFLWLTPLAPHTSAPDYNVPTPEPKYAGYFANLPFIKTPSFNEADVSDKPWFMQPPYLAPMNQALVDLATNSLRKRRETLLSVDDMVAAVVAELKKTGQYENTYIIFTSDNGYFDGEHRLPIEKRLAYEESVRVPLIISGPQVAQNVTRSQLVGNIDLTATILDIAQAQAGRALDGQSLRPLLSSAPTAINWRSVLLLEGTDKIPFSTQFFSAYSAVRTDRYKYIEHYAAAGSGGSGTVTEFYDLLSDPYELQSATSDQRYSSVISSLKQQLSTLKTCSGISCWVPGIVTSATIASRVVPSDIGATNPVSTPVPSEPGELEETNLPASVRSQFYSNDRSSAATLSTQTAAIQPGPSSSSSSTQPIGATPSIQTPTPSAPASQNAPLAVRQFSRTLRYGMTGSDVSALQRILAQDTSVYPSALVTGYFGPQTKMAVIRFQQKYADEILKPSQLSAGTGLVGPATLQKLNALIQTSN